MIDYKKQILIIRIKKIYKTLFVIFFYKNKKIWQKHRHCRYINKYNQILNSKKTIL